MNINCDACEHEFVSDASEYNPLGDSCEHELVSDACEYNLVGYASENELVSDACEHRPTQLQLLHHTSHIQSPQHTKDTLPVSACSKLQT